MKAVLLLSGGQDSTTCLFWALSKGYEVSCIGFDYGQSHKNEINQAQRIADLAGVPFKVFKLPNVLAQSSLTTDQNHNKPSRINKELPDSFTAGRNILFLTIAGAYCAEIGATKIITGVCQTDYSGYPDCRRTTIDAMQLTLSLGIGIGDFEIITPLMYLNKAETWKLAKDLGCIDIIIKETLTDYNGNTTMNEWGMGMDDNPASQLRKKGYLEAKELGWI